MSLLGSAVLVNWGGIVQEKEADFNQFESKKYKSSKLANTKGKSELKRNAKKSKLSDKRKKSKKK